MLKKFFKEVDKKQAIDRDIEELIKKDLKK